MTFGEKLRNYLKAANLPAVPAEQRADAWVKAVDQFVEVERPISKAKTPRKKAVSKMTEEQWMQYLESEPALAGVDIKRELGRAQFWCRNKERLCTREFFLNWLGKAERTIGADGAGQTSRPPRPDPNPKIEPAGWFAVAVKLYGEFAANQWRSDGWLAIDIFYRLGIIKAML